MSMVQKHVFKLKKSFLSLVQSISSINPGIFFWKGNNTLEGIFICHVDDIVYDSTNKFESEIISKLKQTFKFGTEDAEAFPYIGINPTYGLYNHRKSKGLYQQYQLNNF